MQVSNRRSHKGLENKVTHSRDSLTTGFFQATGSSFVVLANDTYDNRPRVGDADRVAVDASDALLVDPKNIIAEGGLGNSVVDLGMAHESRLVAIEMNGSGKRILLRGSGSEDSSKNLINGEHEGSIDMASKDVVVQEPVTVKVGTHVVVRVVERGADLGLKKGEGRRSISGLKDSVTKGNLKVENSKKRDRGGGPARTKQSSRQPSKVGLDEWVGSFDRELEDSMKGRRSPSLGSNQ
ncbi:hypothetical protein V6N11_075461 [Hibiscus sabdariffa]|uniref:Uncharacterized protein n=1 Tax=Hibiscus sabdariffa TaxID=183260 RepID=A0ABR2R7A3_9ROSI